jgi:quercetin dioxygenase-like cupin family protein
MKYLTLIMVLLTYAAAAQTVTILPTKDMVEAETNFISLGKAEFSTLSPNSYSEEEMSAIRFRQHPGYNIDLHLHYNTDEYIYILEGDLTIQIRDSSFVAAIGTFLHIPAGTPHAHRNESAENAEMLLLYRPGKMVDLFRAWARLVASGVHEKDDLREHLSQLPEEYDLEFIKD